MAADQRKRRPSSTTGPFGYGIQEHYRAKKREFRSLQYGINNNHVSLKWDDDEKKVVAKVEQVGISSRHVASFGPVCNAKLADVISVPKEVFELSDLSEALNYEVWQSLLSEEDRSFLAQFLPQGFEADQVVEGLLGGENFHFGNPSLKWGSSLCSGFLHPDAIVQHEKFFKFNKKAYCSELQQYHDNMIMTLLKLKEICVSSNDPEAEIVKVTSRSKANSEINILPEANGYKSHKLEENAMYESPSSIPDEKYYSDNQKLSTIRDAEIQRRIRNQELMKDRNEKGTASPNGFKAISKAKKVEKSQKANITCNDGTKYMSYVKISKKQHELVKSMKQSGTSIQSKNLNRLLGGLDSFSVKPYEMFVEEEQMRIHEHWTNMVKKDLPAALHKWRNEQLERLQIMNSLCQEMEHTQGLLTKSQQKKLVKPLADTHMDVDDSRRISEDHQVDKLATQSFISDDDKEHNQCFSQNETSKQSPSLNINEEFNPTSLQNHSLKSSPSEVSEECEPSSSGNQSLQSRPLNVNIDFDPSSMEQQSFRNSPLNMNEFDPSSMDDRSTDNLPTNDNQDFNPMDLNAEENQISSKTNDSPEEHVTQTSEVSFIVPHIETHGSATVASVMDMPDPSVKNVWSSIGLPESHNHAHPTLRYASPSELSVRHPQIAQQQPVQLMDLESGLPGGGTTKDLLNRHTNQMSFLDSYANRGRNEVLQTLIKRDNIHQEQKVLNPTNLMLPPSQFPSHFRDQLQPSFSLDQRQRPQSELFLNPNIQTSIYPDSRFSVQGQEQFSTLNVRDWSNARISTPMQSQLNSGGLLNQNWFPNDNRVHSGWSAPESSIFPSTSLISGSSGDQSLFSVLSQCTSLQPRPSYNPMTSTEQMFPSTSYGQDMASGIPNPISSNPLPQTASPFDYLSGAEATATLKNPNMGWMTLGHQPSTLHDPSGKPFLKSWNP